MLYSTRSVRIATLIMVRFAGFGHVYRVGSMILAIVQVDTCRFRP